MSLRHPVNRAHHEDLPFGARAADSLVGFIGSWRFVLSQGVVTVAWMALNGVAWSRRWDPFPWILLNLCYSLQAGITGPLILLAGNRQSAKDRATLEHAAAEADKADAQNERILAELLRNTEATLRGVQLLESRQPRGRRTRPAEALRPSPAAPTEVALRGGPPRVTR